MTAVALEDVVALPAAPVASSWTATTATPGPEGPDVEEGVDPDSVTPGVLGFLVTLFVVGACIPLFLSMTRKVRRVQHRARLEEEAGAADGAAATGAEAPRRDDDAAGEDPTA